MWKTCKKTRKRRIVLQNVQNLRKSPFLSSMFLNNIGLSLLVSFKTELIFSDYWMNLPFLPFIGWIFRVGYWIFRLPRKSRYSFSILIQPAKNIFHLHIKRMPCAYYCTLFVFYSKLDIPSMEGFMNVGSFKFGDRKLLWKHIPKHLLKFFVKGWT